MTIGAPDRAAAPEAGGPEVEPLLTSVQVAHFVARGFLRFDAVVPHPLGAEALREIEAGARPGAFAARRHERAKVEVEAEAGRPADEVWAAGGGLAAVMRLPVVRGIVRSLLGGGAIHDHHHAHVVEAGHGFSQPWHADAIIDPRAAFDIQLFFFFHDTPRAMGGTMILPGSHLRRVHESDIARYQNFLGQAATVCPAGTVLVCHHGLWHCGQPNRTGARRYMWKVRLNPATAQRLTWNTADLSAPEVPDLLTTPEPWHGNEGRLEIVNRLRLWRRLIGDERFDAGYWLTRLELPRL